MPGEAMRSHDKTGILTTNDPYNCHDETCVLTTNCPTPCVLTGEGFEGKGIHCDAAIAVMMTSVYWLPVVHIPMCVDYGG